MDGSIDLATNRRGYNILCQYYSVKKNNTQLLYDDTPTGFFYAREENASSNTKETIDDLFQFSKETILISTMDNIEIATNDKVIYKNQEWIVNDYQQYLNKNQSEFNIEASKKTYIQLRK